MATATAAVSGKVVLVTGASSGIGAGTAVHLASLGYSLALSGRNVTALRKVAQQCEEHGLQNDKILLVPGDLSKDDDARKIVETAVERFGQIDVLVNSAGILHEGDLENSTMEDFDRLMNINLRAPIYLTKLCVPHLIKTKGNIINVSSIASTLSFHQITFYCISKAALDQFTRCLAAELAPKGVRVNSVNPGTIKTEIHKRAGHTPERYEQYLKTVSGIYPVGRVGEVDEVVKSIAFLISEDASFILGALLPIDGGRSVTFNR